MSYPCFQGLSARVSLATRNAVDYLERNMPYIEQYGTEYEIAIVSYALTIAKSAKAEHAFKLLYRHAKTIGKFYSPCRRELVFY